MLSNLEWLSVKQRIMFLKDILVFKIVHSKTPNYMSHSLVPVSHQYGTSNQLPTSQDIKKATAFFIAHNFNIY